MNFINEQTGKTEKKIFKFFHTEVLDSFMNFNCYSWKMVRAIRSVLSSRERIRIYLNTVPISFFLLLRTYSLNNYEHCTDVYVIHLQVSKYNVLKLQRGSLNSLKNTGIWTKSQNRLGSADLFLLTQLSAYRGAVGFTVW